ncbi:hypothetical protein POTOM_001186 [Populus tomentosa]|uniref:Uncharacterized protein n=1 Tax=Populus tomentosa TaxID=118781 RepID=A0A8X8IVP5_POPTO|nr:hypothetical protein POTOM_001186 [Populus tomentosa]
MSSVLGEAKQMERAIERSASSGGGTSAREGTAKSIVADQISQAVQSTSNLLHLMQQSSPSQCVRSRGGIIREHRLGGIDKSNGGMGFSRFGWEAKHCIFRLSVLGGSGWNRKMYRIACAKLMKLPKNLLAKASTIKNTGQVLDQMPKVISSLDAHMDSGLQSVPHLRTAIQLLANMESCQLSTLSQAQFSQQVQTPAFLWLCVIPFAMNLSRQVNLRRQVNGLNFHRHSEA